MEANTESGAAANAAENTEPTFQMNDGKSIPRIGFGTYQLEAGGRNKKLGT